MSLGSTIALIKTLAGSGGGGTNVVANPTLAGTEADLTGLQVGDTKYKVGGGALVVHVDGNGVLDKTWQEINDAVESNTIVVGVLTVNGALTQLFGAGVWKDEGSNQYGVNLSFETYVASSASGYPVLRS